MLRKKRGPFERRQSLPTQESPLPETLQGALTDDEGTLTSDRGQSLFTHITISRDQTESSDYKKKQLIAVSISDPNTEDRETKPKETRAESLFGVETPQSLVISLSPSPPPHTRNEKDTFGLAGNFDFDFDKMLDDPGPHTRPPSLLPHSSGLQEYGTLPHDPVPRPFQPSLSSSSQSDSVTRSVAPNRELTLKRKYPYDTGKNSTEESGLWIERSKDRGIDHGSNFNPEAEVNDKIWEEQFLSGNININASPMIMNQDPIARGPGNTSQSVRNHLNTAHGPSSVHPLPHMASATRPDDQSALVGLLQKRVSDLEKEIKEKQKPTSKRPRIQVFHIVQNGDYTTTCLQEPTWTFDNYEKISLKAELPLIITADQYLERNQDIVIAIYKMYKAPDRKRSYIAKHVKSDTMPPPRPYRESLRLISIDVQRAVELFLRARGTLEREFPTSFLLRDHIPAPYLFWYRSRHSPPEFSALSPIHQMSIQFLVGWIESNYKDQYKEYEEKLSRGRISKRFMKFVFSPGDVIVLKDSGRHRAYLTTEAPPIQEKEGYAQRSHIEDPFETNEPDSDDDKKEVKYPWRWNLPCWSIGYDGDFYKVPTTLYLELQAETYDDEVSLEDLKILPLQLVGEVVEQQLRKRGHTFWSCRVKKFVAYHGDEEDTLNNLDGRYMIDFASYKTLHLDKQGSKNAADRQDNETLLASILHSDSSPSAPAIYLFPPKITGFSLRRKRWTDLEVDRITDVSWNKSAFKHLVADDKTKELVQALVANRIASEKNTDLIQGKGNGLIMLLHGGPGTGKTFTAESVAEMAEKPLYPVTCGDIGTDAVQVEKYLESVLHMGKIWDCVVLLDEADVFLEERTMADLTRNALVSVFLRILEYYDGILILTSNRVGTFDEAFKSRIQLALHYPSLTKAQRCRIWKNFLDRLRDLEEPGIDFDDIGCSVTELAEEELNGRQIRNAITIGRQLAKFQQKDLCYQHLVHVIKVAGQFDTYIKNTKEGWTDEQAARANGIR